VVLKKVKKSKFSVEEQRAMFEELDLDLGKQIQYLYWIKGGIMYYFTITHGRGSDVSGRQYEYLREYFPSEYENFLSTLRYKFVNPKKRDPQEPIRSLPRPDSNLDEESQQRQFRNAVFSVAVSHTRTLGFPLINSLLKAALTWTVPALPVDDVVELGKHVKIDNVLPAYQGQNWENGEESGGITAGSHDRSSEQQSRTSLESDDEISKEILYRIHQKIVNEVSDEPMQKYYLWLSDLIIDSGLDVLGGDAGDINKMFTADEWREIVSKLRSILSRVRDEMKETGEI
jgi:hypothetical protein